MHMAAFPTSFLKVGVLILSTSLENIIVTLQDILRKKKKAIPNPTSLAQLLIKDGSSFLVCPVSSPVPGTHRGLVNICVGPHHYFLLQIPRAQLCIECWTAAPGSALHHCADFFQCEVGWRAEAQRVRQPGQCSGACPLDHRAFARHNKMERWVPGVERLPNHAWMMVTFPLALWPNCTKNILVPKASAPTSSAASSYLLFRWGRLPCWYLHSFEETAIGS